MNKFIKEQLNKTILPMSNWNDSSTKVIIYKQGSINNKLIFEVGKIYNISIEDYILDPPPSFTLASNWNSGTNPPEKQMQAEVLQVLGKMIKFKCRGQTSGVEWEGWLPNKSITIL